MLEIKGSSQRDEEERRESHSLDSHVVDNDISRSKTTVRGRGDLALVIVKDIDRFNDFWKGIS